MIVTLANGDRARIRPLRYLEDWPIRELHAHLSPQSRYLRYLTPMASLPEPLVRQFAAVDGWRKVALVAESEGVRNTVAIGSFDAIDDATVEIALTVRDDWQRQRLGTEIARRLVDAAEARGFRRFTATFHTHNTAIRRLLDRVGVVVCSTFSGGVSEVTFVRRPESPDGGRMIVTR